MGQGGAFLPEVAAGAQVGFLLACILLGEQPWCGPLLGAPSKAPLWAGGHNQVVAK